MKVGEDKELGYLPEDVMFNILTRIPPIQLVNNLRYVCKSWHHLFTSNDFIIHNAIRNKDELLIQLPTYYKKNPCFATLSLEINDIELAYKLDCFHTNHEVEFDILPHCGRISSSCNGILLINDATEEGRLYIVNLATKSGMVLPPRPTGCTHKACGSALGFDPNTKQYKVAHIYDGGFGFEMFTMGDSDSDNAWKKLTTPFYMNGRANRPYNIAKFHWDDPVVIYGQYLHWFVETNHYIITMDLSEIKSCRTYLPGCLMEIKRCLYTLFELGGKLSCISNSSYSEIDVWILENFQKQEWVKKHTIVSKLVEYTNLGAKYRKDMPVMAKLIAVSTLRNGEVIMFEQREKMGRMYLYDMKKMEMKQFKMKMKDGLRFIPHRSSLLSWKTKELQPLDNFPANLKDKLLG